MTPLFIPSYKNEDFFLCHLFPTPCYLSLVICYFARSALKRIAKVRYGVFDGYVILILICSGDSPVSLVSVVSLVSLRYNRYRRYK